MHITAAQRWSDSPLQHDLKNQKHQDLISSNFWQSYDKTIRKSKLEWETCLHDGPRACKARMADCILFLQLFDENTHREIKIWVQQQRHIVISHWSANHLLAFCWKDEQFCLKSHFQPSQAPKRTLIRCNETSQNMGLSNDFVCIFLPSFHLKQRFLLCRHK